MEQWAISDTHFNHDRIITLSERPFENVTEMNEHMIAAWNARVKPDDLVYHLGDVAYPPKTEHHVTFDELAARLNGYKILVEGNHDIERNGKVNPDAPKIRSHWMWEEVHNYLEVKFGKSRFVMCHYPLETWRNAHRDWYHLHGHCHGTLKRQIPHRLDMGVDCWPDFAPVNLEHIRDMLKAQEDYLPQDHHGDSSSKIVYV